MTLKRPFVKQIIGKCKPKQSSLTGTNTNSYTQSLNGGKKEDMRFSGLHSHFSCIDCDCLYENVMLGYCALYPTYGISVARIWGEKCSVPQLEIIIRLFCFPVPQKSLNYSPNNATWSYSFSESGSIILPKQDNTDWTVLVMREFLQKKHLNRNERRNSNYEWLLWNNSQVVVINCKVIVISKLFNFFFFYLFSLLPGGTWCRSWYWNSYWLKLSVLSTFPSCGITGHSLIAVYCWCYLELGICRM